MKFPNPFRFFKSVVKSLILFIQDEKVFVTEEVSSARLKRCQRCYRFEPEFRQCLECSCFVDLKVQLAAESCPKGFWRPVALTKLNPKSHILKIWQKLTWMIEKATQMARSILPL